MPRAGRPGDAPEQGREFQLDVLELADRLWDGRERIEDHHPVGLTRELAEVAERTAFVAALGNVSAFETDEGLVLVDSGGFLVAPAVHEQLRAWSDRPVHTAILSHGHIDHVLGAALLEECADRGPRGRDRAASTATG